MKSTLKAMIAKGAAAGLVAGALIFAAPAKGDAQQFAIGVTVGRPVVYPDFYARRAYYEHLRIEEARQAEIARHDAWVRHEEWLREHRIAPYRYGFYGR